jgi:diaminopimelate epimerase
LVTPVELGASGGAHGVWISMGEPAFGPEACGTRPEAVEPASFNSVVCSRVPVLAGLEPLWSTSQFVRVGNPHCVTILPDPEFLPSWEMLHAEHWLSGLRMIADRQQQGGTGGLVCAAGVNLRWAARIGRNRVAAMVFERGEGPTRSSGTSAVAVAVAALRLGLVDDPQLDIGMAARSTSFRADLPR